MDNLENALKQIYLFAKPAIPRWLQINLRRWVIQRKRRKYARVWPIDERAKKIPEGWLGWPEGKRFAFLITHDVERAKGQEKCRRLTDLEQGLGLRSSFNFMAKEYNVSSELKHDLVKNGFEVGVHGLYHNGNLFGSKKKFREEAFQINHYLKQWGAAGFRTPSMYHNLGWMSELNIEYDSSTFDTDPFEPQPDGVGTIFPFWVTADGRAATPSAISLTPGSIGPELQPATRNPQLITRNSEPVTGLHSGFVELPYTLPQDFTLFILMKERNIDIWKKKLDWIVENGGMALLITHPDYMNCEKGRCGIEEYPMEFYEEFLHYVKAKYDGQYWNVLPKEMARFWKEKMVILQSSKSTKESLP